MKGGEFVGLEIINKLKKQKGITSEELARLSGVPLGTLNKILNGTTKDPKLETLKAIAKTLECNLDDFSDNNEVNKNKLTAIYGELTEEKISWIKFLEGVSGERRKAILEFARYQYEKEHEQE
jgi:transcriptional regulator with XRE-family HTH domain